MGLHGLNMIHFEWPRGVIFTNGFFRMLKLCVMDLSPAARSSIAIANKKLRERLNFFPDIFNSMAMIVVRVRAQLTRRRKYRIVLIYIFCERS